MSSIDDPDRPAAPVRPPMSDLTPAPIAARRSATGAIKVSRALWWASATVAACAVVFALLYRDPQVELLGSIIETVRPTATPEDRDLAVQVLYWGSIGAVAVIAAVQLLLVMSLLKGRSGARWALVVAVVLNAIVTILAAAFVAQGMEGVFVASLLGAQLVLAAIAAIVAFLPGAGAWLRLERESHRRVSA